MKNILKTSIILALLRTNSEASKGFKNAKYFLIAEKYQKIEEIIKYLLSKNLFTNLI